MNEGITIISSRTTERSIRRCRNSRFRVNVAFGGPVNRGVNRELGRANR